MKAVKRKKTRNLVQLKKGAITYKQALSLLKTYSKQPSVSARIVDADDPDNKIAKVDGTLSFEQGQNGDHLIMLKVSDGKSSIFLRVMGEESFDYDQLHPGEYGPLSLHIYFHKGVTLVICPSTEFL